MPLLKKFHSLQIVRISLPRRLAWPLDLASKRDGRSGQMERRRSGPGADRLTSSTSSLVENIVQPELDWRSPPPTLTLISGQPLRIAISRWRLQSQGRVEVASDTDDDCHVLSIALRRTRKELFISGKSVWLGGVRDEMLLTGPKRGLGGQLLREAAISCGFSYRRR